MKKTFAALTILTFVLLLTSCTKSDTLATSPTPFDASTIISQNAVPTAVVTTFTANFSGATEVEWHRSSNEFEAEFNHLNQRQSASFDDKGHENEHHITSLDAAVPQTVLAAFRTRYSNDVVTEWKLTSNGTWKAHFIHNGIKWEAIFSATGGFISEEH